MSSLDRLMIRGIRSYPTNEDDVGIVEFQKPLTVILGNNGSGKTMSDARQVDGLVSLDFHDVRGRRVNCTRRVQAKVSGQTVKCKGEECTLIRLHKDGTTTKSAISAKQADVTSEMGNMLGVNKAIINNVIFCHQENSDWPMGTDKDVKEIFDKIFCSDQYTKAIVKMEASRKTLEAKCKEIDGKAKVQARIKDEQLREEERLQTQTRDLAKYDAQLETLQLELNPMKNQLDKVNQRLADEQNRSGDLKSKESLLAHQQDRIKQLQKSLDGCEIVRDATELQVALKSFEMDNENVVGTLKRLKNEEVQLKKTISDVQTRHSDRTRALGSARTSLDSHKGRITERSNLMRQVANDCQLFSFVSTINDQMNDMAVSNGQTQIQAYVDEEQKTLSLFKEKNSGIEKAQSDEREGVSIELAMVKQRVSECTNKMAQNRQSTEQLNTKLTDIAHSNHRLPELERERDGLLTDLRLLHADFNVESQQKLIDEMQIEMDTDERKMASLNDQLSWAYRIEQLIKQHADDQTKLDAVIDQNRANFRNAFPSQSIPAQHIRDQVDRALSNSSSQLKELRTSRDLVSSQLLGLTATAESSEKTLTSLRSQHEMLDAQLKQVTQGKDVKSALADLDDELAVLRKERSSIEGEKATFEKLRRELDVKKCCPLCERGWQGGMTNKDAKQLKVKLDETISSMPSSDDLTLKIEQTESRKHKLIESGANEQRCSDLQEEILSLEIELRKITAQRKQMQKKYDKEHQQVVELEEKEQVLNRVLLPASDVDRLRHTLDDNQMQMDELKAEAGQNWTDGTESTSIKQSLNQCQMRLQSAKQRLQERKTKFADNQQKSFDLNNKILEVKEKINASKEGQQQLETIRLKIKELEADSKKLKDDKRVEEAKIPDLCEQLRQMDKQLDALKTTNKQAENDKSMHLIKINHQLAEILKLNKIIKQSSNVADELKSCEQQLEELAKKKSKLDDKLEQMQRQIGDLEDNQKHTQSRRRQLDDNQTLLKMESSVAQLCCEIDALKDAMCGIDVAQLETTRRQLMNDLATRERKFHQISGKRSQLDDERGQTKKHLDKAEFKNARMDYRNCLIELEATRLSVSDLNRYVRALDMAVLKYHSEKMDEINGRLSDYWQRIYQEDDIVNIRIETVIDSKSKSDKRKNYCYRLMMHSGKVWSQMKHRCSAGQKVLACILVRLALAETFCTSCGMITLDEPTTNLDKDKSQRLAQQLHEMIEQRRQEQNFQIVVITHDKEFVDKIMLAGSRPNAFFKVAKVDGFSTITAMTPDRLH